MRSSSAILFISLVILATGCGSHSEFAESATASLSIATNNVAELLDEQDEHRRHLVSGDFDGDGYLDNAYAATTSNDAWTLVVHLDVLNDDGGEFVLLEQHTPDVPVDEIRLAMRPPDRYLTVCGHAPGTCEADKPTEVILRSDAILLVVVEASASLVFRPPGSSEFVRHWLSD